MDRIIQTKDNRIAFIKACWHESIVNRCLEGFRAEMADQGHSGDMIETIEVPGSFDIPLLAKRLALSGRFDAIVAAGFVVDGGIYRHDFVAASVINALMQIQLETGVPVISAVLTPHQFQETKTHEKFFGEHFVTKGKEAAEACLKITANFAEFGDVGLESPGQVGVTEL